MLTRWFSRSPRSQEQRPTQSTTFRPNLERLEEREVLSGNPFGGMIPIQVNSVTNGAISQGSLPFTANVSVGVNPLPVAGTITVQPAASSTAQPAANNTAQILDLHLNPISLNLLGLGVQTSSICLDITATQGGGLLGNLLYGLANSLDNGGTLNGLQQFLLPLVETLLLNGALGNATSASAISPTINPDQALPPGANDILHLSLGPVNLNLLGLNVYLNNCATPAGPVTVDVYTETGQGELLGNLLNDVAGLLNSVGTVAGTTTTGQQLLGDITGTVLNAV